MITQRNIRKEQGLQNWQCRKPIVAFIMLGVASLFCFIIAIFVSAQSTQFYYHIFQYDQCLINNASYNQPCSISFNITADLAPPIFFRIQLFSYYQNYQYYISKIPFKQLSGDDSNPSECQNFLTNSEMGESLSVTNQTLNQSDVAIPCGLASESFLSDQFELFSKNSLNETKLTRIPISTDDIAWQSDIDYFRNTDLDKQWIDLENNQRFMNWMRVSGLGTSQKLWGRIDQSMPAGDYVMRIKNYFSTKSQLTKKYIVFHDSPLFLQPGAVFLMISFFIMAIATITGLLFMIWLSSKQLNRRYSL